MELTSTEHLLQASRVLGSFTFIITCIIHKNPTGGRGYPSSLIVREHEVRESNLAILML